MSRPRIAVIIPTIGRPDDLRTMLGTLVRQTVMPDEFVLVNAGPMDLQDLVAECLAGTDIVFKYATCKPGTSLQRNVALDMVEGDFYFLFDDDVRLEEDYIERSMECFELNFDPPVGVVLGTFNGPPRTGGWRRTYRQVFGMTHSIPGDVAKLQASGAVQWLIDPPAVVPVPVASGGRVVYRAECFRDERFDEFLPGYTVSEDVELSYRISKKWTI
ncbi:MAG: glycosyltransferase involved in cell wall biosynthesis, partial [Myxococcota bacterium]